MLTEVYFVFNVQVIKYVPFLLQISSVRQCAACPPPVVLKHWPNAFAQTNASGQTLHNTYSKCSSTVRLVANLVKRVLILQLYSGGESGVWKVIPDKTVTRLPRSMVRSVIWNFFYIYYLFKFVCVHVLTSILDAIAGAYYIRNYNKWLWKNLQSCRFSVKRCY